MVDDVKDMLHVPRLKARALVLELNERREMMDKGLINGLKKHEEKESWGYRCLCRCEFLVPCLYRMLGGGPTYEKEKQIKWSDYLYCCEKTNKKKKKRRRGEKTRAIINDYAEEDRRSTESSTSSDEETHELLG
ncbi:unnamed protein product [Peronospora belbahrii]|nr:unnamed protein product [Peronospora belbahrii]